MLENMRKTTLENGFGVYFIPLNRGSNVVSVNVFYKVGSGNESRGISGISHMLEHLNFKSTANHPAGEFDAIIKSLGGVNNASTGFDYTHYFVKCAAHALATPVELFADMLANLQFREDEFAPEREVVLEERRWRTENDPFGALYWAFFGAAYDDGYNWTPIGYEEDIRGFNVGKIRDFHARFYQPQNAFLLVCGDTSWDEVERLARREFGGIANRGEVPQTAYKATLAGVLGGEASGGAASAASASVAGAAGAASASVAGAAGAGFGGENAPNSNLNVNGAENGEKNRAENGKNCVKNGEKTAPNSNLPAPANATTPAPANATTPAPAPAPAKRVTITKPSDVEMVILGFKIPPFNHPDAFTLSAISSLLSAGKSSLFERVLCDELALVSQIDTEAFECKNEGLFLIFAVLNEGVSCERFEREVWRLLGEFSVSEAGLGRLKNMLKTSLARLQMSSGALASAVGGYLARGDLTPFLTMGERLDALTADELKSCAARYFVEQNLTCAQLLRESGGAAGANFDGAVGE